MYRTANDRRLAYLLWVAIASLGLAVAPAHAVEEVADGTGGAGTGTADPGSGNGEAEKELRSAYQKEYAFLVAQKRELQQRIEQFRQQSQSALAGTRSAIDTLQEDVLAYESEAESLQQRINDMEREREAARQNADVLAATFQQAAALFSEHDRPFMNTDAFNEQSDAERLAGVFSGARELLDDLGSVRSEPGGFYDREGSRVEGTVVHFGDVAAYGMADDVAGVLAPAGGGELKIWKEPAPEVARAMATGTMPPTLSLFMYQSLDQAVSGSGEKTLLDIIRSGGVIAWVIVGLGGIAVLLILARIVFLKRASASTRQIVDAVGGKVRAHDLEGALEVCQARKGSTAAVVAAALRNIEREREQLDDIINEAILHESTHLERFGSLILVIAAVSPLLGLLGTVTGMISTFDVITEFGTGDPKLLSGGISVALVTTEIGLIVAIPALLIGNILSGWADRIKDDMQKAALRVTNLYQETALPRAA